MTTRRDFLKSGSLITASLFVPQFLKAKGIESFKQSYSGKKIIVIQLTGGNDGLNCVIPYTNDEYYKLRPALGIEKKDLITINTEVAFNKALTGLSELYDNGNVGIINNVGYPEPNHSHFRSLDIWQSASDAKEYLQTGWLGRWLDLQNENALPHHLIEIDDTLSLALKGEKLKGLAFRNPETLFLASKNKMIHETAKQVESDNHTHSVVDFLHKTLAETTQSASYIYNKSKIYKSTLTYPQHEFGQRLKTIAELICSGSQTSMYYVSLPGFDTHVFQKGAHNKILKTYSDSVAALCSDLKSNNQFNDTLIFTFSEFGRRVKQNASQGTDHGTANNVFIIGGNLKKAGIYNSMPDLINLTDGDLNYTIDFRQVYATLLENWLQQPSELILKKKFEKLQFV
ncbi:MAG TPA: DUF1501 domain-containing protein [Bacteroidia bacterium]|nr:DUF1501 domain-containing protein [Bacteroidia bacterium]HNU32115.1 DUF1501 domain-containing protein [Bacteroidia bacterium]